MSKTITTRGLGMFVVPEAQERIRTRGRSAPTELQVRSCCGACGGSVTGAGTYDHGTKTLEARFEGIWLTEMAVPYGY